VRHPDYRPLKIPRARCLKFEKMKSKSVTQLGENFHMEPRLFGEATVWAGRRSSIGLLLRSGERDGAEPDADAFDRRAIHKASRVWGAADETLAEGRRGPRGESQANSGVDAKDGVASDHARAAHEQADPGAQNIPVFTA